MAICLNFWNKISNIDYNNCILLLCFDYKLATGEITAEITTVAVAY